MIGDKVTETRGTTKQDRSPFATRHAVTQLAALRRFLANGGVIAYPTESCYGLGCDPRNAGAVTRILRLKRRPKAKGLILIAGKLPQLLPYLAPLPEHADSTYLSCWPGPVTLLLPARPDCPRWLTGQHRKLAVRITAHPPAARLCDALDMALVSTSANRAGQRPLRTATACRRIFGEQVWVLEGRVGGRRRPSTILDPSSGLRLRP